MSTIKVKENEPFDVALRRFKRLVEKTGLLNDLRAREFYEKPTWERKRKAAAADNRQYRRLRNQMLPPKLYIDLMSLKEKINEDMKSAMRSKDVALLGTIRLIQAAIKQKEVDERVLVDDNSVISIIEKMLKQRNDSIEAFKKANRTDLVDKEEFEVSVLKNYMPEQMNAEEVEKIIQELIKKIGASSMKEMGPVMAQAKEILSGKANMAEVSKIIKAKLSS